MVRAIAQTIGFAPDGRATAARTSGRCGATDVQQPDQPRFQCSGAATSEVRACERASPLCVALPGLLISSRLPIIALKARKIL